MEIPQNGQPYPPLVAPPPGFNLVECPDEIRNTRLPLITKSTTNPNDNVYFYYTPTGSRVHVRNRTVRNFFREPLFPWPRPLVGLHVETPDGKIWPAHVPSIMDIDRYSREAKSVLLFLLSTLDEAEDSPIVPDEWAELLDPEPTVRGYGRIFLLRIRPTLLATANNTDQIDIFWVSHPMTHLRLSMWARWDAITQIQKRLMNIVHIGGGLADHGDMIPMRSSVVVWNVRGVNRLGFGSRFKEVVDTHKPVIIILMETRASKSQMEVVFRSLCGGYVWDTTNCGSATGGFAALWKARAIDLEFKLVATTLGPKVTCICQKSYGIQHVQACGRPSWKVPKRRYYKLNIDAVLDDGEWGGGGVLRGDAGSWVCGFSMKLEAKSGIEAQLIALKQGLEFLLNNTYTQLVEIESSTQEVAELVYHGQHIKQQELTPIVNDVTQLLSQFKDVTISHTDQDTNMVAHGLASIGAKMRCKKVIYEDPPVLIKSKYDSELSVVNRKLAEAYDMSSEDEED